MGWPPRKRSSGTPATIELFTPATSVAMSVGLSNRSSSSLATPATAPAGVAMTRSAWSCVITESLMTWASRAACVVSGSRPPPVPCQPTVFRANASDEPIRPSPTTCARRLAGEVITQRLRVAQVDVAHVLAPSSGVGVEQDPDALGHRAGHVDLARAEQRDVAEANAARAGGGKGGREVNRRREDDADHVVVDQLVALHHRGEQLLGRHRDLFGRVVLARRGAAHRSNQGRSHEGMVEAISSVIPTASMSLRTSPRDSWRDVPGLSVASWSGPMRVRTKRVTSWPTAVHIRRT